MSWQDTHSVTCAICGELADERRTQNITDDEAEIGPAMRVDNPERFEAIQDIRAKYGEGEVHEACLQAYMGNEPEAI